VEVDLNSDGLMDMVFLLQQENGGSGVFYYVAAAIKSADGYIGTNAMRSSSETESRPKAQTLTRTIRPSLL